MMGAQESICAADGLMTWLEGRTWLCSQAVGIIRILYVHTGLKKYKYLMNMLRTVFFNCNV